MPTKTRDIIAELDALLKTASAKAGKTAAAPGVASMPGSEHDQSTSVKPGDPEATQLMPAGARTNGNAGDNSPLTRNHLKDATQPSSASISAPKPVISGDLGKTAELGNAILRDAANAAILAKTASETPVDRINDTAGGDKPKTPKLKDSSEPAAAAPSGSKPMISGSVDAKTAAQPAAAQPQAPAPASKGASAGGPLELTPDIYQKIGMMLCSSDEGLEAVCAVLEKQAGAVAAQEALAKVAEFQARQAAAGDADDYTARFLGQDTLTARKLGQLAAQEAMADAVQGGEAPAMGTEDVDMIGAIEQLVADGTIDPQVAEALAQLAQSGQLQALLGGDGAATPDAGATAMPDAGAAAMPAAGGDPIAAMLGGAEGGAPGGAQGGAGAVTGGPSKAEASTGEQSDVGGAQADKPKEDKPKEDKPKEDKPKEEAEAQ